MEECNKVSDPKVTQQERGSVEVKDKVSGPKVTQQERGSEEVKNKMSDPEANSTKTRRSGGEH